MTARKIELSEAIRLRAGVEEAAKRLNSLLAAASDEGMIVNVEVVAQERGDILGSGMILEVHAQALIDPACIHYDGRSYRL